MAVIRKLNPHQQNDEPHPYREPPKKHRGENDDSNWLISYADMMTLLCVFYIMMFSMSKLNVPEFEKVKKEVAEQFGAKYTSPTEDLGKFMTNIITETGVAKEATLTGDGVSVSIAFHSTLFFDTMSAEISPIGQQIMTKIISAIASKQKAGGKQYKVVVEGHTDSQPILSGPFPSNWELSSGRATRVVRMFLDHGFHPENLLAIGYADTQPVAESRNADGSWNEEALAKNRRVVLRVMLPDVDSIPWKMKPAAVVAPTAAVRVPATVINSEKK